MRVWTTLVLISVVAGCGSATTDPNNAGDTVGGGDSSAPGTGLVATGVPKQVPPQPPGFLDVGPQGLQLAVGGEAQLAAGVYGADGMLATGALVTWKSLTDTTVAVTSDGHVTALALGLGQAEASDGSHTRTIEIAVVDQPATGATGVTFSPALLGVAVGESAKFTLAFTDAGGQPTSAPAGLVLKVSQPLLADAAPEGTITGKTPGVAMVGTMLEDGTPLAGGAFVHVATKTPGSSAICDEKTDPVHVCGCGDHFPPYQFSEPGLSVPLHVWVARCGCVNGFLPLPQVSIETPDAVKLDHAGVVDVGADGLLSSVAPGRTVMHTFYNGQSCGDSGVRVQPRVTGDWALTCSNGDTGSVHVNPGYWPKQVSHIVFGLLGYGVIGGNGGSNKFESFYTSEESCVSGPTPEPGDNQPFTCSATGSVRHVHSFGLGPCSATQPCGMTFEECGGLRHANGSCGDDTTKQCKESVLVGPDHVKIGTCDAKRVSTPIQCQGAAAAFGGTWTIDGQSFTSKEHGSDVLKLPGKDAIVMGSYHAPGGEGGLVINLKLVEGASSTIELKYHDYVNSVAWLLPDSTKDSFDGDIFGTDIVGFTNKCKSGESPGGTAKVTIAGGVVTLEIEAMLGDHDIIKGCGQKKDTACDCKAMKGTFSLEYKEFPP